jgi:uncharacterized RDD family membrane protein YckC
MAITVLNKANVPTGPFTRAQVADKLKSGEFSLDDLAFVEGLSQWTPLREVLAQVDAASAPTIVTAPIVPAPVVVPPSAVPAYSYATTMAPPSHLVYAGFWLRFVAYLVDGLVISAVLFALIFVITLVFAFFGGAMAAMGMSGTNFRMNSGENQANPAAIMMIAFMELAIWGAALAVSWLYFAKMESGPGQATLGKRVLGLRVTDLAGQRISFARASGRFFGKIVSSMTFYIGFIMAGFTERKQALHDMIASTLVVKG